MSLKDEKQRNSYFGNALCCCRGPEGTYRLTPKPTVDFHNLLLFRYLCMYPEFHICPESVRETRVCIRWLPYPTYPRQSSCICWRSQGEREYQGAVGSWEIAVDHICDKSLFRVVLALPTFRAFVCLHLTHGLTVIQASSLICR